MTRHSHSGTQMVLSRHFGTLMELALHMGTQAA